MGTPALPEQTATDHSGAPLVGPNGAKNGEMSGMRKAAILMIAVGDELAKELFLRLSPVEVQQVTDEIAHLDGVTPEMMAQVLNEFYALIETDRYVVRGGPDYARRLLTEAFGPQRAEMYLSEVQKMRDRSDGNLSLVQKMDPHQLSKFLESEHPQTVALVLAHMDAKKGAVVLMQLDEPLRVNSVRRLAEMREFSPEMAGKVGLILNRRMQALGSNGRKGYAGYKAVAELLNRLDTGSSKKILEKLEADEPKVAVGIRTLMFTFEDLLTVSESSVRELVSAADKRVLALALKGSRENLKAHLCKAMSSRAVDMLKDDMDAMGPVKAKDVGAAQQELLVLARKLESEGKMTLKLESDDAYAV